MSHPTGAPGDYFPPDVPYPSSPAHPPGPGRRSGRRRIMVAAAAAALVLGLVLAVLLIVRDDDKPTASTPGTSTSRPALPGDARQPGNGAPDGAPANDEQTGGTYRTTSKPCSVVDWSPLAQALDSQVDRQRQQSKERAGFTTMICSAGIDADGKTGAAVLIMNVVTNGSAEPLFSGLRGAQGSTVKEIPGIGQGAISYDDRVLGPHVSAYDGNLYISVGWSLVTERSSVPSEKLYPALTDVVRQAMSKMQKG